MLIQLQDKIILDHAESEPMFVQTIGIPKRN